MMKRFERAALWASAGLAGFGAVMFGIQAAITLFEHPNLTGELYGMGTASAACAFVFSLLRDVIHDREESARNAALARAVSQQSALGAPPAEWDAVRTRQAVPVRVERDCPYCAEPILAAAKLCKHCHSDVSRA